ncbi:MAG: methyltransferase domain-containing protein [Thalassolituus sp.]
MKHGHRIKVQTQQRWLDRNDTQRLMALEGSWISERLSHLRGRHMLYAGTDNDPKFLTGTRTQHTFRVGMPWQKGLVDVAARIQDSHWPFADESIDVVVLQHALDMSNRPHQLIREATRSLVSGGYIVIVGFNPNSLWGGARWLRTMSTELPWVSNPVGAARLADWLTLLDFRVEDTSTAAHIWPVKIGSEAVSRRVDRVLAGNRWVPGNVYIMVARKTVAGMTTIRAGRRIRREANVGFAIPAVRETGHLIRNTEKVLNES